MRRPLTLAMTTGALVAAMMPGSASAAAPVGGCPTGDWRIVLPIHQPQAMDHNGDTLLCRLDLNNGSFTFHDNVVPEG